MTDPVFFSKYQALGNDYLVVDPARGPFPADPALIRALCDRHHGVGGDGLLLGPLPVAAEPEAFGLRIFNADGSEAEKSGNGLRIFARHLLDTGHVRLEGCRIRIPAGTVEARFLEPDGSRIQVDMGAPSFQAGTVPFLALPADQEAVDTPLFLPGGSLRITALSLGNPHCVVFPGQVDETTARDQGPRLEGHPAFPDRVNAQFVEVLDRDRIRLEIWERGSGYTLGSGSSACAAAAACRRLGRVDSRVQAHMPGGRLDVEFLPDGRILLAGPVHPIFQGRTQPGWRP